MNNIVKLFKASNRHCAVVVSAMLITWVAGPALAEDIEIYDPDLVAPSPDDIAATKSNVFFMLDTSGSMRRSLPDAPVEPALMYDPTVDYGSSDDDYFYIYDTSLTAKGKVLKTKNECYTLEQFNLDSTSYPIYFDKFLEWDIHGDPDRGDWDDLNDDPEDIIECREDRGFTYFHGTELFPDDPDGYYPRTGTRDVDERYYRNTVSYDYDDVAARGLVTANMRDFIEQKKGEGESVEDILNTGVVNGTPPTANGFERCDYDHGNDKDWEYNYRYQETFYDSANDNTLSICNPKIEILKNVVIEVMDDSRINAGFGRFRNNDWGTIFEAIKTDRTDADFDDLEEIIEDIGAGGSTPLLDAYFEGYRYFSGGSKFKGGNNSTSLSSKRTDSEAMSGGNYVRPVAPQCGQNAYVLLGDGLPNGDGETNSNVKDLPGIELEPDGSCLIQQTDPADGGADDLEENCLVELSRYMATTDMDPDLEGDQTVRTYTIGFGETFSILEQAADVATPAGSDSEGAFTALNGPELLEAFEAIVNDVQKVNADTFVSPAVSVSSFNRLQFRDELYFALFSPDETPRWNGNIKKFRITGTGTIVGADGTTDVIDPDTGFFTDETQDIWSDQVDGSEVEKGGFATNLTASRTLYANTSDDVISLLTTENFVDSQALIEDIGQVDAAGNPLVDTMDAALQAEYDANRTEIAKWTLGEDVGQELGGEVTDPNFYVADSIHSQPSVVSYGTSEANRVDIIFSINNRGLINAINGENGTERWSYIPDESLFTNLGAYFNNTGEDHVYGLDGQMSFLVTRDDSAAVDADEISPIDEAIMFVGQRRGGDHYFAIDIANADGGTDSDPILSKLWTVDSGTDGFSELGQSWSEAVVAKVNYCASGENDCELRDVVIFNGGYDVQYDDVGDTATVAGLSGNVVGNAIYMVDATTGDLLWKAAPSIAAGNNRDLELAGMTHSFPSSPTVIDITGDGAVDIIFAIDISGKVWRIDFNAGTADDGGNDVSATNNTDNVSGGVIANLAETNVDRLFYNSIDATLLEQVGGVDGVVINLITGSGFQAHPLNEETNGNRIYSIFDRYVSSPKLDTDGDPVYTYAGTTDSPAVISDLAVLTQTDGVTDLDTTQTVEASAGVEAVTGGDHEHGYYIELQQTTYEKVLQSALIVDGIAFITSYIPENDVTLENPCERTGVGSSNIYQIDLGTGLSEVQALQKAGIAGKPTLIYVTVDGVNKPLVIVGPEVLNKPETCDPETETCPEDCDPDQPGLKDICAPTAQKVSWWERNRIN